MKSITKKNIVKKIRWIPFALAVTLAAPIVGSASLAGEFQYGDLQDTHWARPAIQTLSQRGILQGYPDGSFRPGAEVTYGEFIKMTVTATANDEKPDNPSDGNWAESYYKMALENGFFTTNNIAAHQLPRSIPRSDMALIVSSALGDIPIEQYREILLETPDWGTFGKREYHIVKSIEYGIITGYPDGTFKPENTLTRAEAAMVIHRLMEWQDRQAATEQPSGTAVLEGEDQQGEEAHQDTLDTVPQRPLTTVERFQTGNEPGFGNWLDTSQSKLPLSHIIDDKNQLRALHRVKYYEIVDDFPYEFKIEKGHLDMDFLHIGKGDNSCAAILIKNRNPIQLGGTREYYYLANTAYDVPFPTDFEYIGFYNSGAETMMLVPNPFQP